VDSDLDPINDADGVCSVTVSLVEASELRMVSTVDASELYRYPFLR
jgi:hypothetical protein